MKQYRTLERILYPNQVMEGADVPVRRYLGHDTVEMLDPFLMLDEIQLGPEVSKLAGFPWHPHAGQATFSYLVNGTMGHEDTLGNKGSVGAGGAQYMEAARGIEHQELPGLSPQGFWGFQLWINLDHEARKLAPTYQNLPQDTIPITRQNGAVVRTVSGPGGAVKNPCRGMIFLDVELDAMNIFEVDVPATHKAWFVVLEGQLELPGSSVQAVAGPRQLGVLSQGNAVRFQALGQKARFLLVSGEPVQEPVFWYGPFVARNSEEMRKLVQNFR